MLKSLKNILDKKQRRKVYVLMVMVIISALMELVGVSLIYPFLMVVLEPETIEDNAFLRYVYDVLNCADYLTFLVRLAFILIMVYVIKNIFQYVVMLYQNYINTTFNANFCDRLMEGYLQKEYEYFLNTNSAVLNRTLNIDVTNVVDLLINCITFFANIVLFIVMIGYLCRENFAITMLISVVAIIFSLLFYFITNKKVKKMGELSLESSRKRTQWTLQSFDGIKEIKMYENDGYFSNKVDKHTKSYFKYFRKQRTIALLPQYVLEVACVVFILLLVISQISKDANISMFISELATFTLVAFRLFPKVSSLNSCISSISYEKISLDKIFTDLCNYEEIKSMKEIDEKFLFEKSINIRDLSFAYSNKKENVIDNVCIDIKKGEAIAFIGKSGAGKTTLVDLIIGILKPQQGTIMVDNENIYDNVRKWKKNIGYIPQSIFLFDDTIMNNIIFGKKKDEYAEERVWEALREAKLDEFVKTLPEGINTKVGEKGVRLSGGQKQRIGIARALYNNPDILVLDEATSALDTETERAIMDSINLMYGKKTIIIIAHRLSTVKSCDKIFEIENGKVYEKNKNDLFFQE